MKRFIGKQSLLRGYYYFCVLFGILLFCVSCGGDIEEKTISGKVVSIEVVTESQLLSTYRYIIVRFDTGETYSFNDWYLSDFVIGRNYDLVVYQTPFSRPVWVILEGVK